MLAAAVALWLALLFSDASTSTGTLAAIVVVVWIPAAVALEVCARWLERQFPATDVAQLQAVFVPLTALPLAAVARVVDVPFLPLAIGACVATTMALQCVAGLPAHLAANSRRQLTMAAFVAMLLPGLFLFQTTVIHDAFQYHATTVSLLFGGDFDTFDEFFLFNSHRSYNPHPEGSIRYLGVPLLNIPALLLGHISAAALAVADCGFPLNGFSLPYTFWLSVSSSAAGVGGLALTFLWVARRTGRRFALAATAVMLWASSLPMFLFLWHGWTHTYSILGVAALLLQRDRLTPATGASLERWYLLGLTGGLLCLIWPVNGLILVVVAVDLLAAARHGRLRPTLAQGAVLLIGVAVGFAPQLAGWYGASGDWVGSTYDRVGDYFQWTQPMLLPLLFSWSQHGLLTWHPIFVPALLGLLLVRERRLALGIALWVVLQLYAVSCWSVWWTGIGFGNRFFLNLIPPATLGLAQVMAVACRPRRWFTRMPRLTVAVLAGLFIFINLSLLSAYRSDIIPMGIKGPNYVQDDPPSLAELTRHLLLEAPATPEFLTQDFWVNQAFVISRLRTAAGGDVAAWGSAAAGAIAIMGAWWLVLWASCQRSPLAPQTRWRVAPVLTMLLVGIGTWLAVGVERSPPQFHFLRFDAGETILRPGQKATFVPQAYLEATREIDILSFLTYAVYVPQGRQVAVLRVFGEAGAPIELPLCAGVDTTETSAYRPEVRPVMAHSQDQAVAAHEWITRAYSRAQYPAHAFLARYPLLQPLRVAYIEIEMLHGGGDLVLRDVFLRG
jgi:hypothetical protein